MRTQLGRLLALALIAILAGCGGDEPAPVYRFTFEPPDSSQAEVVLSRLYTVKQGDSTVIDSAWSRTNQTLLASGDGYEYIHLTDSLVQFRNGIEGTDPVLKIFSSLPITYKIDSSGTANDIDGYEEIFTLFDSMLEPNVAAQLRKAVTPDMLRQQEMQTWNEKFVPYVGSEMTLGEAAIDTMFTNLPVEGQLLQYRITELADTLHCGESLCGLVKVVASTNPTKLAELSGREVGEIAEMFGITDDQIALDTERQAGNTIVRDWVMEFGTMLTHSEYTYQRVFYSQPGPDGQPVQQEMSETQQRTFTY